jgi:hypothetical protein
MTEPTKIKYVFDPEGAECLRKLAENKIWLINNSDKLAEKFDGKYVAIYQGKVVDSDKDVRILGERLRKNYPEREEKQICVDFITKEKYEIILTQMD